MTKPHLNDDFYDFLLALIDNEVEFVIVGAHALAVHSAPRATGDLDILVHPTSENARRVFQALQDFGAPVQSHGIHARDFETPGLVYQMGLPPSRIDVLTRISGVPWNEVWKNRVEERIGDLTLSFLGREQILKNKKSTGRPKDLRDVELLESLGPGSE